MAEVNESIVAKYFELNGYLVNTNVPYTVKSGNNQGDSDIDLVIHNLNTGDKAIVEVKGWHTERFSSSYFSDPSITIYNFTRREATLAAKKLLKTSKFRRVLVVSELSATEENRYEALKYARKNGIDEVLEFKTILEFVISKTEENKSYGDSEFQQTIRVLKVYGFIFDEKED